MKVTRANEYWGVPDDFRHTASFSQAEIEDLLRGPRIHGGLLHWAADDPAPGNEQGDPSMPGRRNVLPAIVPDLQRLEHSLGNDGGSSPSDGSPERWPMILPGDKLMNAGESVLDSGLDAIESRQPKAKGPDREARRRAGSFRRLSIKELWLRAAALSQGDLYGTGKYLGTHDAEVHEGNDGQRWLVKHPRWEESWPAPLDQATGALQQRMGLTTPEIHTVDFDGVPTPVHKMFPATDAFPGKRFDHNQLSPEDLVTLQKHHVLDWLTSNHDSHPGQFIRHRDTGELVGIDKGQAFRYFGSDQLDPGFHPNANYGEVEPIHNTMWRNFARGQGHMNDPRTGELGDFIKQTQAIPDDEYQNMLRPYAEQAAMVGKLGTGGGLGQPSHIIPNDVESFLSAATARKNNLHNDFANLYTRMDAKRQGQMGKVGRYR